MAVYNNVKSMTVDAADNHGLNAYMAVRLIDFLTGGISNGIVSADCTCYATTQFSGSYLPVYAFDTSLSKTGERTGLEWVSINSTYTNQRLTIIFNSPIDFDTLGITNDHASSTETTAGLNNVVITTSTDDISDGSTETTYNAPFSNSTEIYNGVFAQHVDQNVNDTEYLLEIVPTIETPAMTGYTAPSGEASAYSEFSATYPAWKAYDQTTGIWITADYPTIGDPDWNEFEFDSAIILGSVRFKISSVPDDYHYPKDFTIQKYNGISWDVMLNITGFDAIRYGQYSPIFAFTSTGSGTRYRMHITDFAGVLGGTYIMIDELEFFEGTGEKPKNKSTGPPPGKKKKKKDKSGIYVSTEDVFI